MTVLGRPSFWRALSTILLVVFAVSFLVGGFSVPGWGWIAFLLSGVTFAIEIALVLAARRRGRDHPV